MRVTADSDELMVSHPLNYPLLNLSPFSGTGLLARGLHQAKELQWLPDVTHQQPSNYVKLIADKIGLMPVNGEDLLTSSGMPQEQSLVGNNAILLGPVALAAQDIVVAQDEVQSTLLIKFVEQIKDTLMSTPDVTKLGVLPQFVTVSKLDVREPLLVIMCQCMQEQFLVPGKGIRLAVITSVTVAEENEAGRIVKGDDFGRHESLAQSPVSNSTPDICGDVWAWQR